MNFFSSYDLRSKASTALSGRQYRSRYGVLEEAATVMANEAGQYYSSKTYDIFLSHSRLDADDIYGLKTVLEENGFSTYVYWIQDSSQSSAVTPETAERLKTRMKSCRGLVYATSENADNSKWMPWELGYFDGIRGKVVVCPITTNSTFTGREYLGLYPLMEKDLWLRKPNGDHLYKPLKTWLNE